MAYGEMAALESTQLSGQRLSAESLTAWTPLRLLLFSVPVSPRSVRNNGLFPSEDFLTAYAPFTDSLRHMNAKPGDIVAIQGIGGLGHLAIQYARAMGFRVVALSSSASKHELASTLGAHDYIDGSKTNIPAELQKMGGAKIILVTAPSGAAMEQLVGGLGLGGQLVILGITPDTSTIRLCELSPPLIAVSVNSTLLCIVASLISRHQSIIGWPCGSTSDVNDTLAFSKLQGIKCMIERFPLEKAQEAYLHKQKAKFRAVLVPGL